MQMKFLHKPLLVLGYLFFLLNSNVYAQTPCAVNLNVISENTSGTGTTVICNGDPLTLRVTNFLPADCPTCTYTWSNGTTGPYTFAFTSGNYTLTVTDNGPNNCIAVSSAIAVTVAAVAQPTMTGDPFNICTTVPGNTVTNSTIQVDNPCPTCTYNWYENDSSSSLTSLGTGTSFTATATGDYFVQVSDGNSPACTENSRIINVGAATVSVPSITTTANVLCDSNTAILSTLDCSGCSYQWEFYDFLPEEKLVITGVYHGSRVEGQPRGVELYAIGNIPDLSAYSIDIYKDGNPTPVTYTFPSGAVAAHSYVYITPTTDVNSFTNFFGVPPNFADDKFDINGNDALTLSHNTTGVVDRFGDVADVLNANDYSANWVYDTGWAYRNSNVDPKSAFDHNDWDRRPNVFHLERNNAFWGTNAMPNGTYSASALLPKLVITGVFADTLNGTKTRGIELYARGNIPNLGEYGISVVLDGSGITGTPVFTFPTNVSVNAGEYIYVTDDTATFNSYFSYPTITHLYGTTVVDSIDGNDAVQLLGSVVTSAPGVEIDVFGQKTYTGTPSWSYGLGWVKTSNNRTIGTTFTEADWTITPNAWNACSSNINSACTNEFVLGGNWFTTYYSDLVITGVFDNTRNSSVKGIEFYVLDDIPDLSLYGIYLDNHTGYLGSTSAPIYTFPNDTVTAGTHIYLSTDSVEFYNLFGITHPVSQVVDSLIHLDGNNGISLVFDTSKVVDLYGVNNNMVTANDFSIAWSYQDGWTYRTSSTAPNNGTFDVTNWNVHTHAYRPTNSTFGTDSMTVRTYISDSVGTIQNIIGGINTASYQTTTVGDYRVEVQYPNSCVVQSPLIAIDTMVFRPSISAEMPDLTGVGSNITSVDTAYLCLNSYVDLFMQAPFLAPPSWSYQWFLNGDTLHGATGYNYRTYATGLYSVKVRNSEGCISESNIIRVLLTTNPDYPNIENPFVLTSSDYLCTGGPNVTLSTAPCTNCTYQWLDDEGFFVNNGTTSQLSTGIARGYYVIKKDDISGCAYSSSIVEVQDTVYPAQVLSTTGNVVCNIGTVILTAPAFANVTYVWLGESTVNPGVIDTVRTLQSTHPIDSSGNYRMFYEYNNGCISNVSNTIPATFKKASGTIATPSTQSLCNGATVDIAAVNSPNCTNCTYTFLRDGVAMQSVAPFDTQTISLGGSYQVVETDTIDNCADTSSAITFTEVSVATAMQQTTNKICGPNSTVTLSVDSCVGCSYKWLLGTIPFNSNQDTFLQVTGYSSAGTYFVEVTKTGCTVIDSTVLDSIAALSIVISANSTTICDNVPVTLVDNCSSCIANNDYTYQWYFNNNSAIGASFESYQIDTPGTYYVVIEDANKCQATSNAIVVQEFTAPTGFALDFAPLGTALPLTYGFFHLDTFLQPVSLHSVGSYSSLTAGGAIVTPGDSFNVSVAGSGLHIITYSYTESNTQGSCTFTTSDTIEVLDPVDMTVTNMNPAAPAFEACISDTLTVTLTNFTFIPTTVQFVAGGANVVSNTVFNTSITTTVGVHSGTFDVIVPAGARTGKLTLTDGTSSYESNNFFVIQNPAVTIDLLNAIQPVCANLGLAEFSGIPSGGTFSANYSGQATNPALMTGNQLILDNVDGYVNGARTVMMKYTYPPTYTGTTVQCPDVVEDSLAVIILDTKLDSVAYTPIAYSQTSEALSNLTLTTYPVYAKDYTHSYTGTYVIANTFQPSSLGAPGIDSVKYEINNGGCINSSTDTIEVWPTPTILDSMPNHLCSAGDTVTIQRTADSIWVTYRGNVIYSNTQYVYSDQTVSVGSPMELQYSEKVNLMQISSSGGGLVTLQNNTNYAVAGPELYHIVPNNVTGGSTTINIKFIYERVSNYFDTLNLSNPPTTVNTTYTIAEVSKTIFIENSTTVAINPVILADTIFCPINNNNQFLGVPGGGQYYLNGSPLSGNIFNPTLYPTGTSYQLTYVYTGQACSDSASTGIYLPNPFSIGVLPNNGTGQYCETDANDSISFALLPPSNPLHPIDTNSAQFYISNIQGGTVFSPTQVGPPGNYPVRYVISDIYGCSSEALDTFTVNPNPVIAATPLDPTYCLNADTTQIHLYQTSTNGTVNELTYTGIGYVQNETVTLTDTFGIVGGGNNPSTPYFSPAAAGAGTYTISYTYVDSNSCSSEWKDTVTVLGLPSVSLMLPNGLDTLESFYCENDSIAVQGFPVGTVAQSGYGTDTTATTGNPLIVPTGSPVPVGSFPSSFDIPNQAFKPNVPTSQPSILQEVIYYWYIDGNGCTDTARQTINIRNFTTDPTLVGFVDTTCASDVEFTVRATPDPIGWPVDTLGWFTSSYTNAFSNLGASIKTDSTVFSPDSTGVQYAGQYVNVTFHYTDTSKTCFNSISDSIWVNPLPTLQLSEVLASTIAGIDPLGSKLIKPNNVDTFHHVCISPDPISIYAYQIVGIHNSNTGLTVVDSIPSRITPDIGIYSISTGVKVDPISNDAYVYYPDSAGGGKDTIQYLYTDPTTGCTDSIHHYIVVDTLPPITFGGLSGVIDNNRHIYCESDTGTYSIVTSPLGVSWTLLFDNVSVTPAPLILLNPSSLADPNGNKDYPLEYQYVGFEYATGAICADTIWDTIQIRPATQLAWGANVPTSYCVLDALERIPLSATPTGGVFNDITNASTSGQVVGGIISDTLFNPAAQPGKRDITYTYNNLVSGCEDVIHRSIYVYTKPQISFTTSGGCVGSPVEFTPQGAPYGFPTTNPLALDSITEVIWDFGDTHADTFTMLSSAFFIPTDTHTYATPGIYFPTLTVRNQGVCDSIYQRRIVVSPLATPLDTLPYTEYFDNAYNGWMQETGDTLLTNGIPTDTLWQWGQATGSSINTSQAGNNVWVTRKATTYQSGDRGWVYSPCFDLTNLDRPMIELAVWRDSRATVDGAVLQYHDNTTNTWQVLGDTAKGINWYPSGVVVSSPGYQVNAPIGWSGVSSGWENARYRLDNPYNDLRDRTDVRLRIAFAADSSTSGSGFEGFAFDSVRIGNRSKNVLLEHFSVDAQTLVSVDNSLYTTVFSTLYGRDVSLIQYHINDSLFPGDAFYDYNKDDVDARVLAAYQITGANQVRVNGGKITNSTTELLSYPILENLDIECLEDPLFDVEFIGFPAINILNNTELQATVKFTALQDLPTPAQYVLRVAITEDSLITAKSGHMTMAVFRGFNGSHADSAYTKAWTLGETKTISINWPFSATLHPDPSKLQMVAFIQNEDTDEIYQVANTRNLALWQGSVDSAYFTIDVDKVEDRPGWEVVNMKLYPNPANTLFNVSFEKALEKSYEWYLVDAVGRTWRTGTAEVGATDLQVNTNELSSGMYIFIIKNQDVYTQRKVIIQKY